MTFSYDLSAYSNSSLKLCGVDEVGRGPFAGPVVACAIIMPNHHMIEGVKDSKKVSEKKRKFLYPLILKEAVACGIGVIHAEIIDEINIKQATRLAMKNAIYALKTAHNQPVVPDRIFIDAETVDHPARQESIIKGDEVCYPIACASIIAKVFRDRMMVEYDELYPGYGFDKHKGYGTKQHQEAILEKGLTPIHRRSFTRKLLERKR